ncbi:MAG: sugar ABC transporter permease [Brachybacterium sp.]|nr:sugar ABC transporter permease [Brachybacterium sp.]
MGLGLLIFYIWPIVRTVMNSFQRVSAFGATEWTGLDNYSRVLSDTEIPRAFGNTLLYTVVVMCGIPIAVLVASLINRPGLRFSRFYRVMFFMPYLAMPVAITLTWRIMFNSNHGMINYLLSLVGIEGPVWLASYPASMFAVSLLGLWASFGFAIVILTAGLRSIPHELYEASSLDGAGPVRQFFSITVPLLTPSIFLLSVMTAIGSFQLFDQLYAMMDKGNPALQRSKSLVYLFYEAAFVQNQRGYASVLALLILVVIALVTFAQFRLQKRWVNYV